MSFDKERWLEASELLEKPHRSLSNSLLSGFRSAVAGRRKDEVARLSNLQEALEQAKRAESFAEFIALFEVGKRLGDRDMQRKACQELVRMPARFLPGGQQLGFLDLEFGADPAFLASLYQKLAAAKPDDALIVYRKALLDFIVSGESETSLKEVERLLADYPAATSLRCGKALILAGTSSEDALAWLEGEEKESLLLEGAFEKAVYAYLLRRVGEAERASRLERRVSWSSLPQYLQAYLGHQSPS